MKKAIYLFSMICLCAVMLSGCQNKIVEETKKTLDNKVSQALELYADINQLVEANGLEADKPFYEMKDKLTTMATQIKGKMAEATEEDGQMAIKKLDEIIVNLQEVKANVEKSIEEQ